jgi:hypothetical protein
MRTRRSAVGAAALAGLAALGLVVALVPAHAQQFHRHSFAGKTPALVRGDANVRVEEKEHDVSTTAFKSQPSSEHVKLVSDAGTGDAAFIHYYYETPVAPVAETLTASVWVKATKPGIQLRARVVFPKEPDPARPELPLTMLIVGDTSDKSWGWQKLTLENVPGLVGKHLPVVQAKIGRAVNREGAYIDRLVLNLYAGPGPLEVWVDDLDIGPVNPTPAGPSGPTGPGVPTKQPKAGEPGVTLARGRQVEQRGGQLLVDGKSYFFRAIRHTGTPLHVLRAAGFDAVWLPADAPTELVDEATREGWFVVPAAPLANLSAVATNPDVTRERDRFTGFLQKFGTTDVLFWDLGGGLTEDQIPRVELTAKVLREGDRRRPLGGDLWDGFQSYSQHLDVVGAHRWPLFTSLELPQYQAWLAQRRQLAGGRSVFWTWVQNHLPEWYLSSTMGKADPEKFDDPIGPNPEQVRLLAYIALASGCQGLGFWSDRFLADSHHGRDRLQGLALLNTELDMLAPVLTSASGRAIPVATNHPGVKAFLIRCERGLVLLPIWMGSGSQYVPEQGAVPALKVTVPLVPDGVDPWRITPAGVECLRENCEKRSGRTEITIPEFDLVSPIVFTSDLSANGLVVWWQDHGRKYGRLAARWALDMAAFEYEKVRTVHMKLADVGSQVTQAEKLLLETHKFYREAQKHFANELYDKAYLDATRALRPLRVLMRDHWHQAVATLDLPTASPYAVSYFSLPRHWELYRQVQASRPAASVLKHGAFEFSGEIPATGVQVQALPGWGVRAGSIENDRVAVAAGVVRSEGLADDVKPREAPKTPRNLFSPSRPISPADEGYVPPAPEMEKGVLKLEVRGTPRLDRDGKEVPHSSVLERTFLAVDSPPVRLPPGTLVRVSGWVKVPNVIGGTADGVLFYDDAGGEPLAVRLMHTLDPATGKAVWKHFHLYRRVPATGTMALTMALTGVGVAYFDDVRIEPLVPGAAGGVAGQKGGGTNVVPVGYRPK